MNTPALPTLRLVAAPETDASRKPARLAALAQAGSRGDSGDLLDPLLSTVIVAESWEIGPRSRGDDSRQVEVPPDTRLLALEADDGTTVFIRADTLAERLANLAVTRPELRGDDNTLDLTALRPRDARSRGIGEWVWRRLSALVVQEDAITKAAHARLADLTGTVVEDLVVAGGTYAGAKAIVWAIEVRGRKAPGQFRRGFNSRLQMNLLDLELTRLAMRLGIQSGHDPTAMQDGQHKVSVATFGLRHIALEGVVEIEHGLATFAIPDQRIKRREQRGVRGLQCVLHACLQGPGVVAMHVGRLLPTADIYRKQRAACEQWREIRILESWRRAEIVVDPACLGNAQCPDCVQYQLPGDVRLRRHLLSGFDLHAFQHAFAQVIYALEALASGNHQLTPRKQGLQPALFILPCPPATGFASCRLEIRRSAWTVLADVLQYGIHSSSLGRVCSQRVFAGPMLFAPAMRAVRLMQGIRGSRCKAGLVGPALEDPPLLQRVFQPVRRVIPKARKQHQVGTARDHMDGVDLQDAHALDAGQQIRGLWHGRRRREQTLRMQVQVAGLLDADARWRGRDSGHPPIMQVACASGNRGARHKTA